MPVDYIAWTQGVARHAGADCPAERARPALSVSGPGIAPGPEGASTALGWKVNEASSIAAER